MKNINQNNMFFIIFYLCSVSMVVFLVDGSTFKKSKNSDIARMKRSLSGHGLYLFGNDSSEFISIPSLFPSMDSNTDQRSVPKEHTTQPYAEDTHSQYTTYYFTSSQYESTTNPPLRLLPLDEDDSGRTPYKNTDSDYDLEHTKIAELMQDIEEQLLSDEATSFLHNLQNDFQRMAVLTNLYNCPFIPLCKFSLSLNYENYAFLSKPMCCDNCSCRKNECVSKGTCCPDVNWFVKKPRVLSHGVEEKCLPTGIRHGKENGEHIKALTGCPLYTDPELVQKCVKGYDDPSIDEQFEDMVMVTDLSTKQVYRNKYCALCDFVNVSNIIYWSPELVCLSEPRNTSTAYETLTALFKGELTCDIEFIKPDGLDMLLESCSYAISSCNVTGLWTEYDQVTETACAAYGSYIYKDYSTAFRNIFCALCNGFHLSLDNVCTFRWNHDFSPVTFSRMLLLKETQDMVEEGSDDKKDTVCGTGKLFDIVKKKCREARCSTGRKLEDKKCHTLDDAVGNLTININLRLVAPSGIPLTEAYSMVQEIITPLTEHVQYKLNVTNICGLQVILVSNIKTEFLINVSIPDYNSFSNVNSSNLKTVIDTAELRNYDVRLQITTAFTLEQITKFMSNLNGSKVSFRKRVVEKSAIHVYPSPTTIFSSRNESFPHVPDLKSNSVYIFHIHLAHGIHAKSFELVAKTGYFLMADNVHDGPEIVDIHEALSYLSFLHEEYVQGFTQLPYLRWNDELALCNSNKDSKDLAAFQDCPMFIIPWSEMNWTETADGLEFADYSIRLDISEFIIERADDFSTRLLICIDTYEKKFSVKQSNETFSVGPLTMAKFFISVIGVSASIICLIISLVTFCLFQQLQTIPGKNNMALIVSLLFAQFLYVLGSLGGFDTRSVICKAIGLLTHFFWLLSVFWMHVCTFHMCRVLLRTRNLSNVPDTRRYVFYHSYCIALAILFVSINVTVSLVKSGNSDMGYGNIICYVSTQSMIEFTFGIPATFVVTSNIVMFFAIVIKLKNAPTIQKNVKNERNYLLVFIKLSTVTGVTWIFGFIYMWSEIEVFSFLFINFNAFQGIFIMLAFVINTRTLNLYKNRFTRQKTLMSSGKHSTLTATTTA